MDSFLTKNGKHHATEPWRPTPFQRENVIHARSVPLKASDSKRCGLSLLFGTPAGGTGRTIQANYKLWRLALHDSLGELPAGCGGCFVEVRVVAHMHPSSRLWCLFGNDHPSLRKEAESRESQPHRPQDFLIIHVR